MSRAGPAGTDALPVEASLDALDAALGEVGAAVLTAPPGSGKTTRAPLRLLESEWLTGQCIVLLEPRRVAARAAAARMASTIGERLGETVGYSIRDERRVGHATRIEVVTEGLLVRRLQADPALDGVGLVIFDEFHERSLDVDLALALCIEAREALRPELRLLVMSATLDATPVAALMGADTPVISASGRQFDVDVHYLDRPLGRRDLAAGVAGAVRSALDAQPRDVLVFLPGVAEIGAAQRAIGDLAGVDVLPLHARLPSREQDRALTPSDDARRVVLATNIAESSLTIPGVGAVVDSGLERRPRFDPNAALTHLETHPIAHDAADQRAGRAGRLAPGQCWRLWTRAEHTSRPRASRPEMADADLAPLALQLACWGTRDPGDLRWLDAPPAGALAQARELLVALGAMDTDFAATAFGGVIAALPLHPRLAAAVANADKASRHAACLVAALLSEGDPWRGGDADLEPRLSQLLDRLPMHDRTGGAPTGADRSRVSARHRGSVARARRVAAEAAPTDSPAGAAGAGVHRVAAAAAELGRRLKRAAPSTASHDGGLDLRASLARAFHDFAALPAGGDGLRYRLANGRAVRLGETDALRGSEALIVLDAGIRGGPGGAGDAALVRLAFGATRRELADWLAARITSGTAVTYVENEDRVVARRERRLGQLMLESRPLDDVPTEDIAQGLVDALRAKGAHALPFDEKTNRLRQRTLWLAGEMPEVGLPDLGDAALLADLEAWLTPWLEGLTRLRQLDAQAVREALLARFDRRQRRALDEQAPERLDLAADLSLRVDYTPGQPPVVAAKLQRLFGVRETPRLAGGRVPVRVHLLSPAGRPVQITDDLASFWTGSYAEVRRDLRGRYPKHAWPEDPTTAAPERRRPRQ